MGKAKPSLAMLYSCHESVENKIESLNKGFEKYLHLIQARRYKNAEITLNDSIPTILAVDCVLREKIINESIDVYRAELIRILDGIKDYINKIAEAKTK